MLTKLNTQGFPDSSVGEESTCNAGDSGSIPGLGRSAGERMGYPLQYSWPSLVAQLVKNPPAMRETCILALGWEDPLEKRKATHSHRAYSPWGHKESDTTECLSLSNEELLIFKDFYKYRVALLKKEIILPSSCYCCCSVPQQCLTIYNPMDCSTPDFPVFHCLLDSVLGVYECSYSCPLSQ